jgi:4-hydroxy-tetrahydrodipicolinate synthase
MTMNVEWLRGCATALVTPFKAGGEVDLERFRALVERQINGGVRLLVPCGTTGESVTLSAEEDQLVIEETVRLARGRARVIAGAGSNSTAHAIEYSHAARAVGADAVLVVAPYYNKPTQAGLYAHFRAVAEAVEGLPVVVYNVPGRTSSNITAETTLKLADDCENVVATKGFGQPVADHGDFARAAQGLSCALGRRRDHAPDARARRGWPHLGRVERGARLDVTDG